MDDKDEISNLKLHGMTMGIMMFAFRNFAVAIIKHVRGGRPLDDAAIAALRDECLLDVKNSEMLGISIEDEAKTFRQVVEALEEFLDSAIAEARQG